MTSCGLKRCTLNVRIGSSDGFVDSMYSFWIIVLLYSEKADQLTFEIKYIDVGGSSVVSYGPYI